MSFTNSPIETSNKNKAVNIIIRLMLSDLSWPKVITLSGAYCICVCDIMKLGGLDSRDPRAYKYKL